jgi:amino-acid N-acetyltransferase
MEAIQIYGRPSRPIAVQMLLNASLPVDDLMDRHMEHFFFAGSATKPAGIVGLELCGPDALLRSLVVDPAIRSRGLGRALVATAETHARTRGVRSIYLLTTTAEPFFQHLGYVSADRAGAPREIRATREFAFICPASSAFMVKHLL